MGVFAAATLTVDLRDLVLRFVMMGSPEMLQGPGGGPAGR
jgi:hypothetical protein